MTGWFLGTIAVLIVTIIVFIVRAVRLTKAEIDGQLRDASPGERESQMRELAERIRDTDVPCPRCGTSAFFLLGTGHQYRCDSCQFVFEGPEPWKPDVKPGATGQGRR